MKTQIKPIVDALGELVEVEYLEGGERCAPYQGESAALVVVAQAVY